MYLTIKRLPFGGRKKRGVGARALCVLARSQNVDLNNTLFVSFVSPTARFSVIFVIMSLKAVTRPTADFFPRRSSFFSALLNAPPVHRLFIQFTFRSISSWLGFSSYLRYLCPYFHCLPRPRRVFFLGEHVPKFACFPKPAKTHEHEQLQRQVLKSAGCIIKLSFDLIEMDDHSSMNSSAFYRTTITFFSTTICAHAEKGK